MNTLFSLAQIENQTSSVTESEAAILTLGIFFIFYTILFIAIYLINAAFLGRIFKKAGLAQWAAWVPFYNSWKLLEIGGQKGFWSLFVLTAGIPLVGILTIVSAVFMAISMYHIGKKLGKDGTFVLWEIFLPIVWVIWLAVDKSTWNDSASTAPSLAKGPKSAPVAKA
jgi:hypothetical protein